MGGVPIAGPQEVRDRRIRAALHEITDPVAAIEQPAALAIDEGEAGLAGDDALEAGEKGRAAWAASVEGASAGGESVMA